MKIAIISLFSGLIDRGVETWVKEISPRLASLGNEVTVLQGGPAAPGIGYQTVTIPTFNEPLFSLKCLPLLWRMKPDIIVPCNGGTLPAISKFFSVFLYTKCKIVITGHAGLGLPDKWNLLLHPDCFVSPSLRGKEWAQRQKFARGVKIVHIPHGVDLGKFSPSSPKIQFPVQKPIILCVSAFEKFKRVEEAIRAVSHLDRGSLVILGGDHDQSRGQIDALGVRLLGPKRYLKIHAPHSEMPRYYASADVFTLPSDSSEAFGIVYIEALASNLPIVATDDKLRREIIGPAGIFVDPTNISRYSAALKLALTSSWDDKPRRQAEKFSWEKIALQYHQLFKSI